MNLSFEFSKIKESFKRVKEDMIIIENKINSNYDDFLNSHKVFKKELNIITDNLKQKLDFFKLNHLDGSNNNGNFGHKNLLDIKAEISNLKKQMQVILDQNYKINQVLQKKNLEEDKYNILSNKVKSCELEVFLLKEKLAENEFNLKQLKETNLKILNLIEDLSKTESEIMNKI